MHVCVYISLLNSCQTCSIQVIKCKITFTGNNIFHFAYIYIHIYVPTHKSLLNLVDPNQIWTVITLFRLMWSEMEFLLVPNQSEKC